MAGISGVGGSGWVPNPYLSPTNVTPANTTNSNPSIPGIGSTGMLAIPKGVHEFPLPNPDANGPDGSEHYTDSGSVPDNSTPVPAPVSGLDPSKGSPDGSVASFTGNDPAGPPGVPVADHVFTGNPDSPVDPSPGNVTNVVPTTGIIVSNDPIAPNGTPVDTPNSNPSIPGIGSTGMLAIPKGVHEFPLPNPDANGPDGSEHYTPFGPYGQTVGATGQGVPTVNNVVPTTGIFVSNDPIAPPTAPSAPLVPNGAPVGTPNSNPTIPGSGVVGGVIGGGYGNPGNPQVFTGQGTPVDPNPSAQPGYNGFGIVVNGDPNPQPVGHPQTIVNSDPIVPTAPSPWSAAGFNDILTIQSIFRTLFANSAGMGSASPFAPSGFNDGLMGYLGFGTNPGNTINSLF